MGTLLIIRNLKNTNSGFKISSPGESIDVTEFTEQTITIHVASEHLASGLLVSMDFILYLNEGLSEFGATGKIDTVDAKNKRVKITLHQFDKKIWALFFKQLENKQNHIDELLAAMKGQK